MRLTIAQNAVRVLLRMPGKISEQVLVTGYVSLAWRKKTCLQWLTHRENLKRNRNFNNFIITSVF